MGQPDDSFLLILTGPDGAGKTTIAQALHKKYGWKIIPFSLKDSLPASLTAPEILEGKYAAFIPRISEQYKLLSILLITKKEIRYERLIKQCKMNNIDLTRKQVIQTIRENDEQGKKEFEILFPELQNNDPFFRLLKDTNGKMVYDWFINTSHKSIEQVVDEVEQVIQRKLYSAEAMQTKTEQKILREDLKTQRIPTKGIIFKAEK